MQSRQTPATQITSLTHYTKDERLVAIWVGNFRREKKAMKHIINEEREQQFGTFEIFPYATWRVYHFLFKVLRTTQVITCRLLNQLTVTNPHSSNICHASASESKCCKALSYCRPMQHNANGSEEQLHLRFELPADWRFVSCCCLRTTLQTPLLLSIIRDPQQLMFFDSEYIFRICGI